MAITSSQSLGRHMIERRQRSENAGVADEDVEPAIALAQRGGEAVDAGIVLQVERHQRRGAAGGADGVVEFLQPADGARHRDDMRAGLGERQRGRVADAARGAGDERDAVGERFRSSKSRAASASARLGEQRQLPRRGLLRGAVGTAASDTRR